MSPMSSVFQSLIFDTVMVVLYSVFPHHVDSINMSCIFQFSDDADRF